MEQQDGYAIKTEGLSRSFFVSSSKSGLRGATRHFFMREKTEHVALKPTDLSIRRGEIIGLVGANGAGKTTLIKLLSGLIHPSAGTAQVLGFKPWERHDLFLKKMSVVLGQKNQLWWDIPARESFELLMAIYGLERTRARAKIAELAEILHCTRVLATPLRKLSLGERMKMELIGSLLHEPDLLFLDEPTIGLDILSQTAVRDFIRRYAQERRPTIILTSHYMDDIAQLVERLLLIRHGSIVFDGPLSLLMSGKTSSFEEAIREFLAEARSS